MKALYFLSLVTKSMDSEYIVKNFLPSLKYILENEKAADIMSKAAFNGTEHSVPEVDRSKLSREVNREKRSESRKREGGPTSYSPTPDNSPIHKHRF